MWIAGWAMPGCLPEMIPVKFDAWKDAQDFILDELWRIDQEDAHNESASLAIDELTDNVIEDDSWSSNVVKGYVYWIERSNSRA
jgi:hypothetical protein